MVSVAAEACMEEAAAVLVKEETMTTVSDRPLLVSAHVWGTVVDFQGEMSTAKMRSSF
jgi:hypothetical protein